MGWDAVYLDDFPHFYRDSHSSGFRPRLNIPLGTQFLENANNTRASVHYRKRIVRRGDPAAKHQAGYG
jgi:hypothetical protein